MHRYRSINEDDGDLEHALDFIRGDKPQPLPGPHEWEPMPANVRLGVWALCAAGVAAVWIVFFVR